MLKCSCMLVFLSVAWIVSSRSLTLTQLQVPTRVTTRKGEVVLKCKFALNGAGLYSVKWFKDDQEFYRYMPNNQNQDQEFTVSGINLNSHKSSVNMSMLQLQNVGTQTTGTYKCEVAADMPRLHTVSAESKMSVVDVQGMAVTRLEVPSQVDIRQEVTLLCEYELNGDDLYVIKWHKDGYEFYRYHPQDEEEQKFPQYGIDLRDHKSNTSVSVLRLRGLSFSTSGMYSCEVAGDAPVFRTVNARSQLTIVAQPDHEPLIEGNENQYSMFDQVEMNCTSASSNPAAQLTWLINGNKAEDTLVAHYDTKVKNASKVELFTPRSGLRFQLVQQHLPGQEGETYPKTLEISCVATVGSWSWQSSVVSTIVNS